MSALTGILSILGSDGGIAFPGATLLARTGDIRHPDGINHGEAIRYQWLRDGGEIIGAQKAALAPSRAMIGSEISVRCTFTTMRGEILSIEAAQPIFVSSSRHEFIRALYWHQLRRAPALDGLRFWADELRRMEEEKDPKALEKLMAAFKGSKQYAEEPNRIDRYW